MGGRGKRGGRERVGGKIGEGVWEGRERMGEEVEREEVEEGKRKARDQ